MTLFDEDNLGTLGQRIRYFRRLKKLSGAALASLVGVKQQSVSSWESDQAIPQAKRLNALSNALDVSLAVLTTGKETAIRADLLGDAQGETPYAPLILNRPAHPRAASLPFNWQDYDSGKRVRQCRIELAKLNIAPQQVVCVQLNGNSMEPRIVDGALLLVNLGDTQVRDGALYALRHKQELYIKTLYRTPGGGLRAHAFNTLECPDQSYPAESLEDQSVSVIGRVFAVHMTLP